MTQTQKNRLKIAPLDRRFQRPGHLVRRLHQICLSVFLEEAEDLELTPVQFLSLVAIADNPGIDQVGVGRTVALDRQTVSNVVSRLHQRGLVDKKNRDKRTLALYLTPEGSDLVEAMSLRTDAIDERILKPLSADEKSTLITLLLKLVNENNTLSRAPVGGKKPASASPEPAERS